MKPRHSLLMLAPVLLGLSSCMQERPKTLADIPDATIADSMTYYYVQLRAHEYWQKIDNDTTLRSAEQREEFLRGLKAGMKAVQKGNDAYNEGVRMGSKLAKGLYEFEREYGVEVNRDVVIESFKTGLRGINDIPEGEFQEKYYELLGKLKARELAEEYRSAKIALVAAARDEHMTKIGDDLYMRINQRGAGPLPVQGDVVFPTIRFDRVDGSELNLPSPSRVKLGAPGIPAVLNDALSRLPKGSTAVFATPAEAVFGSRTESYGLDNSDILILTVTVNDIECGDHPEEVSDHSEIPN